MAYTIQQHTWMENGQPFTLMDRFDIIRKTDGKRVNEEPLKAKAADRMLADLMAIERKTKPKMEGEETMSDPKVQRWKKIGGGSLRMAGRIIKPGQIFEAVEADIPKAFRDVIVPVDPAYQPVEETPLVAEPSNYKIELRSPGWYDVIDSEGKRVNQQALRQPEAEALLKSLE